MAHDGAIRKREAWAWILGKGFLFMVKGERELACTCVPRSLPRKNVFSLSFIERPRAIQHGGVK